MNRLLSNHFYEKQIVYTIMKLATPFNLIIYNLIITIIVIIIFLIY